MRSAAEMEAVDCDVCSNATIKPDVQINIYLLLKFAINRKFTGSILWYLRLNLFHCRFQMFLLILPLNRTVNKQFELCVLQYREKSQK